MDRIVLVLFYMSLPIIVTIQKKKDPRPPKCQSLTSTCVRTYSQKQKPILEKALLADAMFSVETTIM